MLRVARLRAALLMPAAALAVHQLRYYATFGDAANQQLALSGHAYLTPASDAAAFLAALAAGLLLVELAGVWGKSSGTAARPPRTLRVWLAATIALIVIYTVQETFEGLLASGHPVGTAAVLANGGWTAFLFAAVAGIGVAFALRAADALIGMVATGGRRIRRRWGPRILLTPVESESQTWRLEPLAGLAARRAPPAYQPIA
jgi:hypothetical protein